MNPEDYKLRCDKHNLQPYVYCEMCWLRNEVFESVETARNDSRSILATTHLAIKELNDIVDKMETQIHDLYQRLEQLRNK